MTDSNEAQRAKAPQMGKRWLFSRRRREAEKAWAIYRGVGSDAPMPTLFHAGFSMGASAFARFAQGEGEHE